MKKINYILSLYGVRNFNNQEKCKTDKIKDQKKITIKIIETREKILALLLGSNSQNKSFQLIWNAFPKLLKF